jgi:hypothetical protein
MVKLPVVTALAMYPKPNYDGTSQTDRQSQDVNNRIDGISSDITECYFDKIFQHYCRTDYWLIVIDQSEPHQIE